MVDGSCVDINLPSLSRFGLKEVADGYLLRGKISTSRFLGGFCSPASNELPTDIREMIILQPEQLQFLVELSKLSTPQVPAPTRHAVAEYDQAF